LDLSLSERTHLNAVMNLRFPRKVENVFITRVALSLSRKILLHVVSMLARGTEDKAAGT
jgi:hypothetical protein